MTLVFFFLMKFNVGHLEVPQGLGVGLDHSLPPAPSLHHSYSLGQQLSPSLFPPHHPGLLLLHLFPAHSIHLEGLLQIHPHLHHNEINKSTARASIYCQGFYLEQAFKIRLGL